MTIAFLYGEGGGNAAFLYLGGRRGGGRQGGEAFHAHGHAEIPRLAAKRERARSSVSE